MSPKITITKEQQKIIESSGSIRINAVAGSGKTTTLIQYAKSRPQSTRILYIAFNRSVRLEAQKKFNEERLTNVQVETAHSLAFKAVVLPNNYTVSPHNPFFLLRSVMGVFNAPTVEEMLLATHASQQSALFCNAICAKVEELDYLETLSEAEEISFATENLEQITLIARTYLAKMYKR